MKCLPTSSNVSWLLSREENAASVLGTLAILPILRTSSRFFFLSFFSPLLFFLPFYFLPLSIIIACNCCFFTDFFFPPVSLYCGPCNPVAFLIISFLFNLFCSMKCIIIPILLTDYTPILLHFYFKGKLST